ncbi:hypothetical protein ACU635_51135 [[Actinomadura] parvosata]|uniref:hypothetical protein n=1 Tax=[Actinomadura] parvosata TaxID=1955412 RepID=UPI00406C8D05
MLSEFARASRYFAQTGRSQITARQRRRIKHKRNHQSTSATDARESRSAARAVLAAARRRRRASLPA